MFLLNIRSLKFSLTRALIFILTILDSCAYHFNIFCCFITIVNIMMLLTTFFPHKFDKEAFYAQNLTKQGKEDD